MLGEVVDIGTVALKVSVRALNIGGAYITVRNVWVCGGKRVED